MDSTTTITAPAAKTKVSTFYAGFEDGLQVTGWHRQKDKVHSIMRDRIRDRNKPSDLALKRELEELRQKLRRKEMTLHAAQAEERTLREANKKARADLKFEIRSQGFAEKR